MLVIRTVCGNGIGSSLMAANNVKKICEELGIKADVASVDFANAVGEKADLYVTIKELANQFPAHCHVAIIRSYVHKAKINIEGTTMQAILSFLAEIFSQPAFLMGLIAFVGLVALRSPGNKLLTGTLKPILGYLMLSAGAGVIVANLNPLGGIIEAGFNIRGVIPNNEAIVSVAQKMLGVETMSILLLGFIFNLIIARCTKYKYIFLTGHHSFFLACLFSAVLQAAEFHGWMLILIGGFLLGSWSAISPAIGQRYTKQVTEDGGIAMGHFGSLGYYLSAWIASRTGNPANSFADTEISEKWGFLRDTTVTTGIVMFVIYFVCSAVAGSAYLSTITDQNMLIFSVLTGLQFAVGVAIVYNGVRLILGDLVPAFQGISQKLIPDSIPAVDCAVFFTFSPTAVVVGFISSFVGGLVGMLLLGGLGMGVSSPRLSAGSSSPSCRRCCCRRSATSGLKTAPSPISTSRYGASLSVTPSPSLARSLST